MLYKQSDYKANKKLCQPYQYFCRRPNPQLKGEQLKIILAVIVLVVTVKIIFELTLTPSLLLGQAGGH
jgi:hypothetical protein